MNQDMFSGKWKQFRGRVQEWWGDLTNDDLDRVQGQREQFLGLLQERYGYTRDQAETELDRRFNEFDQPSGMPRS